MIIRVHPSGYLWEAAMKRSSAFDDRITIADYNNLWRLFAGERDNRGGPTSVLCALCEAVIAHYTMAATCLSSLYTSDSPYSFSRTRRGNLGRVFITPVDTAHAGL